MTKHIVQKKQNGNDLDSVPAEISSLTDRATKTLRNRILDLTLEPGIRLDEKFLLRSFDYGRTPMREALNRLIVEGLVESSGNRGVRVTPLNLNNILELFDAYTMSERMVASVLRFDDTDLVEDLSRIQANYVVVAEASNLLEVTELNVKFHSRLAEATRNKFIGDYSIRLHNLARRLSYFIYQKESTQDGGAENLFTVPKNDHNLIIAAIDENNRERLVSLMTSHANFFRDRLSRLINEARGADIEFTAE